MQRRDASRRYAGPGLALIAALCLVAGDVGPAATPGASVTALRAHIDPATGRLGAPPAESGLASRRATATTPEPEAVRRGGVTLVRLPAGRDGRLTARRDSTGRLHVGHAGGG